MIFDQRPFIDFIDTPRQPDDLNIPDVLQGTASARITSW